MKRIGSVTLIAVMLAVLLPLTGASNVKAAPVPDVLDFGTSGVANDGTLIGNTSLSTDARLGNGALRSEAASGAAETTRMSVGGDLADLDMTGSYTFMAWVKVLSDGGKGIIQLGACCSGRTSLQAREGYTLNLRPGRSLRFWGGSSNTNINFNLFTGSNVLNLNQYHHVAVRVQPRNVQIFVDGVSVASGTQSNILTSPSKVNQNNNAGPGAPSIGGSNVSLPRNTADVLIDEVRVYGSAVSDADIALIAAGNLGRLPDRLYYDFEVDTDTDGDGVLDDDDYCPDTVIPEGMPTVTLNPNHWALIDGDSEFDTVIKGKGPNRSYIIEDTAGCSCEQIIEMQGLGDGHTKHGCNISAMDDWIELVTP